MSNIAKKEAIVVLKNGVIAAWHPKKAFPYQHSRPIDLAAVKEEREGFLTQSDKEKDSRYFEPQGPKNIDLREIFYTDKHDWLPSNYLCIFEHFPVYTVGLREHVYSAEEEKRLTSRGAEFHRIRRGGLITFHGPGQLVGYPLLNLRQLYVYDEEKDTKLKVGVRIFVNLVEQVIIELVSESFKIENVGRTKDTGVWISDERKIAAIGIQLFSGITGHGFALNCSTDLSWFENILPCGLEGKMVTSISHELNQTVTVENVLEPLTCHFKRIFQLPVELRKAGSDLHNVNEEELSVFLESTAFQTLL